MKIKTINGAKRKNRKFREPFWVRAKRFIVKSSKVLAVVFAFPAVAFGGWWSYNELKTTPYLAIKKINVAGVQKITKEEMMELSGLKEGQNLLSFDADEVALKLKANPWVDTVEVKRGVPDTVDIIVRERQPIALVKLDSLYVMDSHGVVFKRFSAEEDGLDLPVVTGLTIEGMKEDVKGLEGRLLELITTLTNRNGFDITEVSEINIDPVYGLSIFTLEEGVRLDVGMDRFEEKLASFDKILKTRDGVLKGIEAFDLNNHREVIVRFTTDVVKEGGEADGQKG